MTEITFNKIKHMLISFNSINLGKKYGVGNKKPSFFANMTVENLKFKFWLD